MLNNLLKWFGLNFKSSQTFVDHFGAPHRIRSDEKIEVEVRYASTPFPEYRQIVVDTKGQMKRIICEWDD